MSELPGAIKYDTGKPAFDMIPPEALEEIARVFQVGAQKYSRDNWRQGFDWSRIYGAIQRHLNAFWGGQDRDPETGLLHVAQAAWGCMVLLNFYHTHKDKDNRVVVPGWPAENSGGEQA